MSDKINIEIDLSDLMYHREDAEGTMTTADTLLAIAARQLIANTPRDLQYELANRARAISDDLLREALKPKIEDALTRSVQHTDIYGEPKGEPTTLGEIITKKAMEELKAEKDRGYGKPRLTLVQSIIADEVEKVIRKELQQAIDEAKAEVKSAVQAEGAKVIASTIERMATR